MSVGTGDLAELGGEVREDVGEDCHADDDDKHCPHKFVGIHWQDVAITYRGASDSGPVERGDVPLWY